MKWEDFCKWTDTTAIYPGAGTGDIAELVYIAMGLAGEYGEALEVSYSEASSDAKLREEMRDALWYVARGYRALEERGFNRGLYDVVPVPTPYGVGLRICNVTKKVLRDGVDEEKLLQLAKMYPQALYEVMDTMYPGVKNLLRLQDDLEALRDKLTSRKERGVLGGSGDNR